MAASASRFGSSWFADSAPAARAIRSRARGSRAATLSFLLGLAALAALPRPAPAVPVTRNLTLLAQRDDFQIGPYKPSYASLWCYVHSDGREYAVLAAHDGTAIYNVTVPEATTLVAFVPGPPSFIREMKQYRDWIYVVADATGPGQGLQIIRMTDPEHPVLAASYALGFVRSHTVSVDTTRALLYCNGTHNAAGQSSGMRILSLSNPEAPLELARWPAPLSSQHAEGSEYVHDSTPAGDRIHISTLFDGQKVLDVSDPAQPIEIAEWVYSGCFAHSTWPDSSGRYLYVADEMTGEPLKVWDLANLDSPVRVNQFTSDPAAIVHNPRIRGHELYLSNYTQGVRVLDASDPVHPAEFAWGDSYLGPGGGYKGVWEVCPYLPSGLVLASDMQSGLYVYRVERDYGLLQVRVVEAESGEPLAGAKVVLSGLGDSLVTPADGVVRFAPGPGIFTVTASRFGWTSASAAMSATVGGLDSATLALGPLLAANFEGTLRDAASGLPLPGGQVALSWTPLAASCDLAGRYILPAVPEDLYRVEVRASGHVPLVFERGLGPPWTGQEYALDPATFWDDLESGGGWAVGASGDNATGGIWTRVEPLGTGEPWPARFQVGKVQPEWDCTPLGTMCFVTGQGLSPTDIREQDVDRGRTSLTSPAFNLTAIGDPTIGYWRWFYSDVDDGDWLAVLVSNNGGATWVAVDTTRGWHNRWEERTIRVSDYVTPNSQVRVRFVAADLGEESVVEAAIDDLVLYDAAAANVGVPASSGACSLRLGTPSPNPARGPVRMTLDLPRSGDARVEVLDLTGRRVRVLHAGAAPAGSLHLTWDGTGERGRAAPAGLYFIRAESGGERTQLRFVLVR